MESKDEKRKPVDWLAIEGEYRAGVKSVNSLAAEHGISEGAIRKRAKKEGWSRDPAGTKRQIVKAAMAGGTNSGTSIALRTIESAAEQDIADMERGLRIHRLCLIALETAAETVIEPKDAKTIVEAARAAIDSIRNIRGLNDTPAETTEDGAENRIVLDFSEAKKRAIA